MQRPSTTTNADHPQRLLDLLPDLGSAGFGAAMLRLAHAAAAQHRVVSASRGAEPWTGLKVLNVSTKDEVVQGSTADTRSARNRGPVTTEGDR